MSSTFGIDNFFYTDLYPNQDKAGFASNQPSTIEKLIQIGHFSEQHNNFLSEITANNSHKFIWPQDSLDEVGMMLKDTGIKSGMSILYRSGDSIKNVGFASTSRSAELLNMFLNKSDLLLHFIKYFENEAKEILLENSNFLVDFKSSSELTISELHEKKLKKCIKSLEIKKLYLPSKKTEIPVYLTKREYESLFFLCKGKSSKQIAHILKISPRTVEEYLKTCKQKLRVYNKYELINRALQMEIDKLFIVVEDAS